MLNNSIISCQQLIPEELSFEYSGSALNFELGSAEVACIIGPNYSGKGNWIRTLCGLENQLSGYVYLKGKNSLSLSSREWSKTRMKIAYLHEDTALLSAANGLINVLAPALYHQLDRQQEKQLLVEKALELLQDIDPDLNLDEMPAYLSKQHRYKIAIARALLLAPEVLVLNNPFAYFNSDSKQKFQIFLKQQVAQGLSLLLITHDIPYALNISDKIIFVSQNNVIYFDNKQAILNCDIAEVNAFINHPENRPKS